MYSPLGSPTLLLRSTPGPAPLHFWCLVPTYRECFPLQWVNGERASPVGRHKSPEERGTSEQQWWGTISFFTPARPCLERILCGWNTPFNGASLDTLSNFIPLVGLVYANNCLQILAQFRTASHASYPISHAHLPISHTPLSSEAQNMSKTHNMVQSIHAIFFGTNLATILARLRE